MMNWTVFVAIVPEIDQIVKELAEHVAHRSDSFGVVTKNARKSLGESYEKGLDRLALLLLDALRSRALLAWYRDHNFEMFAKYCYTCSLVDRLKVQAKQGYTESGEFKFLLNASLSFDDDVLYWHSQFFLALFRYDRGRNAMGLPGSAEHLAMQIRLAMSKDADLFSENIEAYFSGGGKYPREFHEDYLFLRGLASGDSTAMNDALAQHLNPKMLRKRNISPDSPWSYEVGKLFCGWAVLYIRLANYYGYSVDVKSEWVPDAWVNVFNEDVNPEKKSVLDFMDGFDLFMPLMDNPKAWCSNASKYSPRPKGQPMITPEEIIAGLSE